MQKVKTFFHVFLNSLLPQATYYHKLTKTSFSFSRKYFTSLVYTVNFIFVVLLIVRLQSMGLLSLKDRLSVALDQYPKELSITVEKGFLQTNYGRPYFFWLDVNRTKKLLAVIDESASPDKINEYKSIVLFTSRKIAIKTDQGFKEISYGAKTIKIDKNYVQEFRNNGIRLLSTGLVLLFLVLILVAPLVFLLMYFVYFFVLSFVVFLFFNFFFRKVKLSKCFQLSLHAATIPVLIDYGLCFFRPEVARLPFIYVMFFILSFVFILSGIYEGYLDPITRTHRQHT